MRPLIPFLVASITFGLLASCGSSPSPEETSDIPVVNNSAPVAPTGPCDISHKDEAIAAAMVAARRSKGHPSVTDPHAYFQPLYSAPQAPGQPLGTPTYGWFIGFTATFHGDDDDALSSIPANPATQAHVVGTSIPALAQQSSSSDLPVPQDPNGTTQVQGPAHKLIGSDPPPGVPNPVPDPATSTHPATLPNLGSMFQSVNSGPGAGAGAGMTARSTRALNVFVAVDGTTQILPY